MLLLTVNHNENYEDFCHHKSVYNTETRVFVVVNLFLNALKWSVYHARHYTSARLLME